MTPQEFLTVVFWLFAPAVMGEFTLTILHTNDFHARYDQTNTYSSPCPKEDVEARKCFGGIARIAAKVRDLRAQYPDSLYLDGGDRSQGTLWYYLFGANVTAHYANLLRLDAMAFGNHEFDRGIKELATFLSLVRFPVLSSNIDTSQEPSLIGKFNKSVVFTVRGQRIGVIGYVTAETYDLACPGKLSFADEVPSIQREVNVLKAQGVNKFIALGHSGFTVDVNIATQVADIDIVIGGHSNTFLYTGTPPSTEVPADQYPKVVARPDGSKALCVQDYAYGKYLGLLHVTFDDAGNVLKWSGNPILLDGSVPQAPDILEDMKKYQANLTALQTSVIGSTAVYLQGDATVCRVEECNLGNFIADAMLWKYLKPSKTAEWNHVAMALFNGGGARSSIPIGNITYENVLSIQPFQNTIDIVTVSGETLLEAFEYCASRWNRGPDHFGGFLQVSGMQVTYDMTKPVNHRVKELWVTCNRCDQPRLEPVNRAQEYRIVVPSFFTKGGDGYGMFRDKLLEHVNQGDVDSDILIDYIKKTSPIVQGLERRIIILEDGVSASPRILHCNLGLLMLSVLLVCGKLQ